MSRPEPSLPGDVIPTPAEFAGWGRMGALTGRLRLGPVRVVLHRADATALAALDVPATGPLAERGAGDPPIALELLRSDRAEYLAVDRGAGSRCRLATWSEDGAPAMVTHGAALLCDPAVENGLVLMARQDEHALARTLQNVIRVAVAWRLAARGRGLLLHASAVEDAGRAVLFIGPSGAGKTTVLRKSGKRPALADDVVVVEAPSREEEAWHARETPLWAEPSRRPDQGRGRALPVALACRLEREGAAGCEQVSRAASAAAVAAHAPFLEGVADPTGLAEDLARRVPLVRLSYPLDADPWSMLEAHRGRADAATGTRNS